LDIWCAPEHPNIANFLGLSYDDPFPAAIILPYYSNGNSLDFVKREETPNILKLVCFDCFILHDFMSTHECQIQGAAKGVRYLHEQLPPIIHADIRAVRIV
jgi:serine/threonine protein kinase